MTAGEMMLNLWQFLSDRQDGGLVLFGTAVTIFAVVALLTKLCVDVYCQWAPRLGLVDKPDVSRKLHEKPVPVGGGIVIFCVTSLMIFGIALLLARSTDHPLLAVNALFPLLFAATILVGVGLLDDKRGMSGKTKLSFQILVASIVIFHAGAYSEVVAFGMTFHLGHLFYPLGIFWLVGMMNSVNLLDGADGVATTAGFFMTVTAGIIALIHGYTLLFLVALIFSAALSGFFLCNRPPAKVYLGDTGSMLIGFLAGVLLMRACATENFAINIVPPLAVALIPVLDSVFAVMRRINSGRSIFTPDRGHIHHRLQEKFGKGYRVLGILSLLMLPGCVAAIAGVAWSNDWIPLFAVMLLVVIAAVTRVFGREELKLVVHRMANRFKKRFHVKSYNSNSGEVFHFQGTGPWRELWEDFISTLKVMGCVKAHLDINMPFMHEDYSSDWENPDLQGKTVIPLSCSLPLTFEKRQIGKLSITFDNGVGTAMDLLQQANELNAICAKYIDDFIQKKNDSETPPAFREQEEKREQGEKDEESKEFVFSRHAF